MLHIKFEIADIKFIKLIFDIDIDIEIDIEIEIDIKIAIENRFVPYSNRFYRHNSNPQ